MTDPLKYFEQQFWSQELLDKHGPELRDQAIEALRDDPDVEWAGLIADGESPAGAALCNLIAAGTGQPLRARLLVGLVPRQMLADLIEEAVEHLVAQGKPRPPDGRFVVLCATRDGMRAGFFALDQTG